jgi:hypothetical protein
MKKIKGKTMAKQQYLKYVTQVVITETYTMSSKQTTISDDRDGDHTDFRDGFLVKGAADIDYYIADGVLYEIHRDNNGKMTRTLSKFRKEPMCLRVVRELFTDVKWDGTNYGDRDSSGYLFN